MCLLSVFFTWLEKEQPSRYDITKTGRQHCCLKEVPKAAQLNGMSWKGIFRSFPMVYTMSKQSIWSTGIIVAWTPAIYICPEWMWKAPIMSKLPTLPHRPGNQCYHLLWWTICWCYHRWWFRMCCLINELHIGPRNPAWTWISKSSRLGMVTQISIMYIFMLSLFNVTLYIASISP